MKTLPPGKLYEKALKIAKSMTLEEIYLQTNLPFSWLRKFRQGEIKAPSVHRIEKIIVATTGKEIV